MVQGGYMGQILDVDLDNLKTRKLKIPDDATLRKFVGCYPLGARYLFDFDTFRLRPGDPRIPLIFMTGPLTGTVPPSPTNITAVSKNYETGFTLGRSHTHGFFGPYLKFSGFDGIILRGRAENLVYIWINDGEIEIRNATHLKEVETHQAEEMIKKELGNQKMSVAVIGPAGENKFPGALIENDLHHSFSHSGMGAVMGSKNVKAIAVYGTRQVPVDDMERLKTVSRNWTKDLINSEMGQFWIIGGKNSKGRRTVYEYDKARGLLSAKNFLSISPVEWLSDIEDVADVMARPCFRCPLGCSYEVKIKSGRFKGSVFTPSGGGENMEGFASMVGIYDTARIYRLVELEDNLGFEAGALGDVAGLAIECYEKGLLTKEDTCGKDLKWGDLETAEGLARMIAYRKGIGKILSLGVKEAAEIIGGDAPKFTTHIKGGSPSHHDWRASWGVLFGQIVSSASGWPAPGATSFTTEPSIGYNQFQDPLTPDGKAEAARKTGMLKFWNDSIGTCWNATWGVPNVLKYTTDAVSAVTGWEFGEDEALQVGERIMNLERIYNVKAGLTPYDDIYNIGPRWLEAPTEGPAKGKSIAPYLKSMVYEYYDFMGWDKETGMPKADILRRLGVMEFV